MLQAVFEQLYNVGVREFCFIVGRGKRAIADHFASDQNFLEILRRHNKDSLAEPGKSGEIQLTDGIQRLIDWGSKVVAVKLKPDEVRLDIGNPEFCWEAMSMSRQYFCRD